MELKCNVAQVITSEKSLIRGVAPILFTSINFKRNDMDTHEWNRFHTPLISYLLIVRKNVMLPLSCYLRVSSHLVQYIYSSFSTINNVVASKYYVVQGKCWFRKLTPPYGFAHAEKLTEDEKKDEAQRPPLVGTSNGTSYWWVCCCGVKLRLYNALQETYRITTVCSLLYT